MTAIAPLQQTTSLTPASFERHKTRQQKAEDVIYTLNHAVTCLSITDTIGIGIAANIVKLFTGKRPNWAEHVHAPGEEHDHPHHDHIHEPKKKFSLKEAWKNAKGWIIGEAVGDLGAVPFTIAVQRFAPGFMDSLRQGMEPFIGKMFRKNTQKAAENWALKNGKAIDSQEVADYGKKLYEYEMHHMPQMAVWTVSSVLLNFGTMLLMNKGATEKESFKDFVKVFMANKAIGAGITGGLVLTVRGLTPGGAHKWDQTIGKHVIAPVTKAIGSVVGIKSEDVDTFHKRNDVLENSLIEKKPKSQITANTISPDEQRRIVPQEVVLATASLN